MNTEPGTEITEKSPNKMNTSAVILQEMIQKARENLISIQYEISFKEKLQEDSRFSLDLNPVTINDLKKQEEYWLERLRFFKAKRDEKIKPL